MWWCWERIADLNYVSISGRYVSVYLPYCKISRKRSQWLPFFGPFCTNKWLQPVYPVLGDNSKLLVKGFLCAFVCECVCVFPFTLSFYLQLKLFIFLVQQIEGHKFLGNLHSNTWVAGDPTSLTMSYTSALTWWRTDLADKSSSQGRIELKLLLYGSCRNPSRAVHVSSAKLETANILTCIHGKCTSYLPLGCMMKYCTKITLDKAYFSMKK